jgi:2-polyprenyl-6-methoxyphenol hydroxylase-like FAD-dependent oxidoreductase
VRVLIAGAGIAGLSVARALRDRGIGYDLVERAPAARTEGAGIYLPANAVRALGVLGFADGVQAAAHPITTMRIADDRGRVLISLPMEDVWGGGSGCVCLPRADLHRVLLADAAVRFGVPFPGPDGYDVVVGADGIRSAVRRSAFPSVVPRPAGVVAWRFLADGFDEDGVWSAWQGRSAAMLAVSLGGGRAYCYAEAGSSDAWPSAFDGFPDRVRALVAQGADAHRGAVEEVYVPNPVAGRTVLIGDAAHAFPPNMAQGAALAVEDATLLAEQLAARPVDEALPAFAARRRARVAFVRAQTARRDKARNLPPPLRDTVIRLLGRRIILGNFRALRGDP